VSVAPFRPCPQIFGNPKALSNLDSGSKSKSSYYDEYKNSIDLFTNHDFPHALDATSSVVF
jgi:hypothetical protein